MTGEATMARTGLPLRDVLWVVALLLLLAWFPLPLLVAAGLASIIFAIAPSGMQARGVLIALGVIAGVALWRGAERAGRDARGLAWAYGQRQLGALSMLVHGLPPVAQRVPWLLAYLHDLGLYGILGGAVLAGLGALFLWPSRDGSRGGSRSVPSPLGEGKDEGKEGLTDEPIDDEGVLDARADEPPPRAWAVEQAVPAGFVTLLFGAGGSGKSLLAQWLCLCAVSGRPFLGLPVQRMPTLYFDGELAGTEWHRRMRALVRGQAQALQATGGLPSAAAHHGEVPAGLHYHRLTGLVTEARVQQEMRRYVEEVRARHRHLARGRWGRKRVDLLIVVDSLTMGGLGQSGTDKLVGQVFVFLRSLVEGTNGAVVAIDHVDKASKKAPRDAEPLFSTMKRNHSRAMWLVVAAEGEAKRAGATMELLQKKASFSEQAQDTIPLAQRWSKQPPACHFAIIDLDREPDAALGATAARALAAAPVALAAAPARVPTEARVLAALRQAGTQGLPLGVLSAQLQVAPKSISNALSTLRKTGRVEPAGVEGEGRWRVKARA